ncbi:MAG: PLP-dependent aminotransferase family protein [Oscillospiraceae bacterium]|nr:PLP-dependent aminotransferase family protein [Oscillospiraceae bacterium]
MQPNFSRRISALQPSAIREILKAPDDPDLITFAAGNPSPDTFPAEKMGNLAAEIFEKDYASALQYGISEGYEPLRRDTAARLREKHGIGRRETDQLIITSGAQQAIELCAKVLLNEGDTILCEDPSFIGALNALRSYGVTLGGIPCMEDGMDLDALEEYLKSNKNAKLIYTIPDFQNPTGAVMPLKNRLKLIELAQTHNVMILEDSPYFELRYDGKSLPSLKALDESGCVIYAGSFSKTIAPGIRLGVALASQPIIQKMVVAKQVSDVHSNLFFQILVHRYIERYDLDEHIARCRKIYKSRRDTMSGALSCHLTSKLTWQIPQGGLFMWCKLRQGEDSAALCQMAKEYKVMAVPGSAFLVNDSLSSHAVRLNFSLPNEEAIKIGIKRLAQAADSLSV